MLKKPQLSPMQIAQGAEATISREGDRIIKERVEKDYRHADIDRSLRKSRTRREAKILETLQTKDIPAPRLLDMDDTRMRIEMDFLSGPKIRDVFHDKHLAYSREIGVLIGKLHEGGIIHHDLTTSNMMLHDNKIHLIDFGLSFFSEKEEDKAVDLHLFRHALESKHHTIWEESFKNALEGYRDANPDAALVLKRLEHVEARGRNKNKH